MKKVSPSLIFILLTVSVVADSSSWPQWRGHDASGHCYPGEYPTKWSAEENLAWMAEIPGRGHSSAVHENGHMWITTAIETPASDKEKEERLKENEGLSTVTVLSEVSLRAVKLDPKTGGIQKNIEVIQKKQPQWVHHLNSYASPSPVIEGNRLYLHFGAYGNACIDAVSGKIIWKNNQKELWVMHENGPGSSPIIWENLMIFHLDGSDKQSIVALFKDTGKIAWQSKRSGELKENPQLRKSYSTPIIALFNGKPILISCSADWVYGYNPRNGEELWKINYGVLGFSNVARPIVGHGMFYISTCFMKAEIHAYKYEGLDKPKLAWKMIKGAPKMPSPILVDKQLYVMNDGGILTCADAISGDVEWRERVGGEFSASPTYANGLLYFSDREGKTTVVKPGSKLNIVAENKIDGTAHMASITPYENSFLLRSKKGLYRIGKK
tara:strand:+ start:345 stop:1664 length:1320 start_codon:yes stop_codon:yes gene_type:complete